MSDRGLGSRERASESSRFWGLKSGHVSPQAIERVVMRRRFCGVSAAIGIVRMAKHTGLDAGQITFHVPAGIRLLTIDRRQDNEDAANRLAKPTWPSS